MEKLNGIQCNTMPFLTTLEELPLVQQLRSFRLSSSKVTSFAPIGEMKNIFSLELFDNPVKNLLGLEKLHTLKELRLSEKEISDLIPLENLPALELLILTEMNLADFNSIQTFKTLKRITLERMTVPSFAFLKDLQNLENLFCDAVTVDSVEGLSELTYLTTLTLINCKMGNLSPAFSSLVGLTSLSIVGTKINSLGSLEFNKNLVELYITEDHYTSEEVTAFKKLHPACSIYPGRGKNFPFSEFEIYEVLQELKMQNNRDNVKAGTKVKFTSYTNNSYDSVDMFYFSELDGKNSFLWTMYQYDDKRANDYFRKL